MKKSEKIEIRISHTEKTSLTRLAESEGQSVSELIRGLARRYAQLNMPRPRKKLSAWHMAGLVLCGIGIGSGLAFSLGGELTEQTSAQYMVHGIIGDQGFGFGLMDDASDANTIQLGEGEGAFNMRVTVTRREGAASLASVAICKQTLQECVYSADAKLEMNGGLSPSVWQTSTETGENLFLVLQPVAS